VGGVVCDSLTGYKLMEKFTGLANIIQILAHFKR
jgi:hypothetical protein